MARVSQNLLLKKTYFVYLSCLCRICAGVFLRSDYAVARHDATCSASFTNALGGEGMAFWTFDCGFAACVVAKAFPLE